MAIFVVVGIISCVFILKSCVIMPQVVLGLRTSFRLVEQDEVPLHSFFSESALECVLKMFSTPGDSSQGIVLTYSIFVILPC